VNNAGITRDNLMLRMDADDWNDVWRRTGAVLDDGPSPTDAQGALGPDHQHEQRRRPDGQCRPGELRQRQGGLIGLTKTTAREFASRGITCNALAPGLIETDLTADLNQAARDFIETSTPLGYIGSVEDVASAAVYFASDEARYVTGQVLGIDGGMMMGS
jgi:3-oxoacyl-[acyl-carrier protein] reductase